MINSISLFIRIEQVNTWVRGNYMFSVKKIRNKVTSFVEEYGQLLFPLPVAELAELKGFIVQVFTPKMDKTYDVSGIIDYENNSIYVNEFDSPTRQRFTIAHELGHLALHENQGSIVDFRKEIFDFNISDEREVEANSFAAELLMPVKEFLEQYEKNQKAIFMISLYFNVSAIAVKYRIKKLQGEGLINGRA